MKKVLLSLMFFLYLYSCENKSVVQTQVSDIPFETEEPRRILDELYNRMSIEERTSQLYSIRSNVLVDNYTFKIGASSEDIRLKANVELKGENQQLFNRSLFFAINK